MTKLDQPLTHFQVLLVEDEADIAELLIWVLKDAGAEVRLVNSSEEALPLLEHYQPDILLCNVRLPQENGDWLIRQIRNGDSNPHLPAIAITSYDREVPQNSMLQAGFHHFLHKPLDFDELIAKIRQLVQSPAATAADFSTSDG